MAVSGWGIFLILLVLAILFGGISYYFFTLYRARRLGLPPPSLNPFAKKRPDSTTYHAPSPAPAGIGGWIMGKINGMRNTRSTTGAYESTGYGGARSGERDRRGFGALDPDEAWDARVDQEAAGGYYEEQELGLREPGQGPYGGSGYGDVGAGPAVGVAGIEVGRGRSRSRQRELDERYDEEVHGGGAQGGLKPNPFGDEAEASSLRSVSPRPHVETGRGVSAHKKGQSSLGTTNEGESSPTERRSMFREDV